MNRNALDRLASAIGYPGDMPGGAASFVFLVDDGEIRAVQERNVIRLSRVVAGSDKAEELAKLAPGRMLVEGAVLAFDPAAGEVFLWQEIPADASLAELSMFFESFLNSCDWWRDMADNAVPEQTAMDEFVIRP